MVAPEVGAAQGPDARYFHKPLVLFRWLSRRRAQVCASGGALRPAFLAGRCH
ncbi:hypothetical protein GJA_3670 [Janthinobacterium agaricidamnosum NBRC 102515 = DSM 9628]|uniref:Uncharacterized protein n=1 Tax=Janthinobacterium agaricidamnosum NBRC 102515 = DSM 9628 TaxID=1349767 RepID=W0V9J1_9BURK|nr:hypothetical protein GJA_3670 [Janthinobacterium agaricidamnosum NBRC 102515 = DSM 9628]